MRKVNEPERRCSKGEHSETVNAESEHRKAEISRFKTALQRADRKDQNEKRKVKVEVPSVADFPTFLSDLFWPRTLDDFLTKIVHAKRKDDSTARLRLFFRSRCLEETDAGIWAGEQIAALKQKGFEKPSDWNKLHREYLTWWSRQVSAIRSKSRRKMKSGA